MEPWQQIESVFQEALQRDPVERDAWLPNACQSDAGLRHEVVCLLGNEREGSDFKPLVAGAVDRGADSLKTGQRVALRDSCTLGEGGTRQVYAATTD